MDFLEESNFSPLILEHKTCHGYSDYQAIVTVLAIETNMAGNILRASIIDT